MRTWLKVLLSIAVLYFGFDLLVIWDSNSHFLWSIIRPHYDVSFSIRTADGEVHTAHSVVEMVYLAEPQWEELLPPVPRIGWGPPAFGRMLNGEAGALAMPNGAVVCMLFFYQSDARKHSAVWDLADRLLDYDRERAPRMMGQPFIDSRVAESVSGSAEIPLSMMPDMVVFLDAKNSHSAHVFDPEHADKWLGAGTTFLGARISVTKAPISFDAEARLPWLSRWSGKKYSVNLIAGKDDPFGRETGTPGLSEYDLLYWSRL